MAFKNPFDSIFSVPGSPGIGAARLPHEDSLGGGDDIVDGFGAGGGISRSSGGSTGYRRGEDYAEDNPSTLIDPDAPKPKKQPSLLEYAKQKGYQVSAPPAPFNSGPQEQPLSGNFDPQKGYVVDGEDYDLLVAAGRMTPEEAAEKKRSQKTRHLGQKDLKQAKSAARKEAERKEIAGLSSPRKNAYRRFGCL